MKLERKQFPKPSTSKVCEEASPASKEHYIPCMQPATALVYHDKEKATYHMCVGCADHNVINRGALLVTDDVCTVGNVPESIIDISAKQLANAAPQFSDDELYGDCLPQASDQQLMSVSELVRESVAFENAIAAAQDALKMLVEKKRLIDEKMLPEAMIKAGTLDFTTPEGTKVKVDNKIYASVSVANRPIAMAWLRETGNTAIIKNEFRIPLLKGLDAVAGVIREFLNDKKIEYSLEESIHAQTLQAFVREQVQKGSAIPFEPFGVHIVPTAVIKQKKPTKKG